LNIAFEQIETVKRNERPRKNQSKFSVIAFSLGGRVALHLLQSAPAQIERMVLIAPDGLHQNFWYWLATQTSAGNRLFGYTMKNPHWFFALISFAFKLRLLNKSIARIVHHYLDDEEGRLLLYRRWTVMRKFKPEKKAIASAIGTRQIPVRFLFGSYDRIILSRRSKFFEGNQHVKVKIIDSGHQLLKEKFADDIASLFSQ
jgi:pimeloyl-ACP methyl ester carboxylesterase